MNHSHIDDLLARLNNLQQELEAEIETLLRKKRAEFQYHLKRGRVRFEQGVKALQKRRKTALWAYLRSARVGHVLTAPVIYSLIVPFVLLDAMVTLYQHVCFRVYNIPRVVRKHHVVIDRHQLAYLNAIEKFNCVYCGYGNGVIEYSREVAARTEQYWCPIKHARRTQDPHRLSAQFVDYGDADTYSERLQALRDEVTQLNAKHD